MEPPVQDNIIQDYSNENISSLKLNDIIINEEETDINKIKHNIFKSDRKKKKK